jgi:hypothetical protein
VHDEDDHAVVIGDVHSPLLIKPDLLGMFFQKLAYELRHLDPNRGVIDGFNFERLPDPLGVAQFDVE